MNSVKIPGHSADWVCAVTEYLKEISLTGKFSNAGSNSRELPVSNSLIFQVVDVFY